MNDIQTATSEVMSDLAEAFAAGISLQARRGIVGDLSRMLNRHPENGLSDEAADAVDLFLAALSSTLDRE